MHPLLNMSFVTMFYNEIICGIMVLIPNCELVSSVIGVQVSIASSHTVFGLQQIKRQAKIEN